ncbi:MAG: peptidylprolyl isomerase [Bacteroidia bacterium]
MKSICSFLVLFILSYTLTGQNQFSNDSVLRVIYTHQYNAESSALLPYFKHENEAYRKSAVMAFASIQDPSIENQLFDVLKNDASTEVKQAAVFSLGQLRLQSISRDLIKLINKKQYQELEADLLMAIGKGAKIDDMKFFDNYSLESNNSMTAKAYVYAVYQAYRRDSLSSGIQDKLKAIQALKFGEETDVMLAVLLKKKQSIKEASSGKNQNYRKVTYDLVILSSISKEEPYRMIKNIKRNGMETKDFLKVAEATDLPHALRTWCLEEYIERNGGLPSEVIQRLLESHNSSFISLACAEIRKDSSLIDSKEQREKLQDVQKELIMPRDFEAWVDIEKALAFINNTTYTYKSWFEYKAPSPDWVKYGYSNPIDWKYVRSIKQNQKVRITTNKGIIEIECKVNESPASVANFLKLVDTGFYNNKYFHRVVPNFVIQGGCPRGDGWGSLNWLQRSEFSNSLTYKPGMVGLASSGKDSEGVQWFITHTYTPHLDGRYTIFAEVTKGMDVVNAIEVGDTIQKVERIK